MNWTHTYTPLDSLTLSALVAVIPFAVLCWQMVIRRKPGHVAALSALGAALVLAMGVWGMPVRLAASATLYGAAFAVFPILWIVITAMWIYTMTVDAGQFVIVRDSISRMTDDRRIQAIFIAFAFGALLESTAGYGSPVAIGAAMLIGLGFPPIQAAGLCLIANTVTVAFAGMGLPAVVAAQVSGLDSMRIGQIVGRQLPLLALFMPLWLSVLVCGWRRSGEIWPVLVIGGLGSSIPTFIFANFHGYTLPGLMGALGSLFSLGILLHFWQPRHIYRFATDTPAGKVTSTAEAAGTHRLTLQAWLPWIALTLCVFVSALGPVHAALDALWLPRPPWPDLHGIILKVSPLVPMPTPMDALFTGNVLSSPGTSIFVAGLACPWLMPGYTYARALRALWATVRQMRYTILTVMTILGLAQLMNYSGMSYTLGMAFTLTGSLFAVFSPVLGWIGVFLTGSDTSSNALFCGMQRTTAEAVGLNPTLAAAANTTGGVAAKMISPQSIAVAVGAANMTGQEGTLLRYTIGHSLLMLALICLMTWLQSGLLAWTLPS